MSKKLFFQGTFILTCTGLISRIIGFFYRIFLSHSIGAEGMGIYQLILPLQNLVLAFSTVGIQTAISRLCAAELAKQKHKEACSYFSVGTWLALFLSVSASLIIYGNADYFATVILKESRTLPLLQLLSFSFPLSTLHTCINSYYFAMKKTGIPAGMQLFEQIIRVSISYLLYLILLSENRKITPIIAVGGSLASELAVALVSLLLISIHFHQKHFSIHNIVQPFFKLKKITETAFPLTLNRILLTLLNSMEVVLIPQKLCQYGLNSASALSVYGVFTGMALPVIMFPSTLTNSAAVMLMPSVAQLEALGNKKRIRYVTSRAGTGCFFLGAFCSLVFFFFGMPIGQLLFKSVTAGTYIRTISFICPFLYVNTAFTSILHGLGKNGTCLIHSSLGSILRILSVVFAVPILGIRGYLYGILLSEILVCLLHLSALFRYEHSPSNDFSIDN